MTVEEPREARKSKGGVVKKVLKYLQDQGVYQNLEPIACCEDDTALLQLLFPICIGQSRLNVDHGGHCGSELDRWHLARPDYMIVPILASIPRAVENSNTRSFVSPPGLEPHQRTRTSYQGSHNYKRQEIAYVLRRLSEATTAVELRQHIRGAVGMAGSGADNGVFDETSPTEMKKVQYAQDNILQSYQIYIPERDPETVQGDQYWILYIHGGYYRDPKVDAASLRPAIDILTAAPAAPNESITLATVPESGTPSLASSRNSLAAANDLVQGHVAGYASINYRLAPHPEYPQDEDTENYLKRVARFPQQLEDIHAAIRHLQTRHNFTNNYILAGHSVGAQLALLAALKAQKGQIDPPLCIVGLNGIYDFPYIHKTNPDYESMTKNTMTPEQYREASPALYDLSDYTSILPKQNVRILLSHSKDDELVNFDQLERMYKFLTSSPSGVQPQLYIDVIETQGQHNTIWSDGKELARSLVKGLRMVTDY